MHANLLALFTDNEKALNQVYNIACGERTDLNQLWQHICEVVGTKIEPVYGPAREGDIPHSLASIDKGRELLGYDPQISVRLGLEKASEWYRSFFEQHP